MKIILGDLSWEFEIEKPIHKQLIFDIFTPFASTIMFYKLYETPGFFICTILRCAFIAIEIPIEFTSRFYPCVRSHNTITKKWLMTKTKCNIPPNYLIRSMYCTYCNFFQTCINNNTNSCCFQHIIFHSNDTIKQNFITKSVNECKCKLKWTIMWWLSKSCLWRCNIT